MSRASPVQETNAVGMQRVTLLSPRMRKAGLVASQAVYPRASNVARRPPEGKLEASGSPCTSSEPEKLKTTPPLPSGAASESCFSAVSPVSGWNQWV